MGLVPVVMGHYVTTTYFVVNLRVTLTSNIAAMQSYPALSARNNVDH